MAARRFALAALLALAGCATGGPPPPTAPAPGSGPPQAGGPGELHVEVVASGLEHPWEIGFLPDGSALVTQRPGELALLRQPDLRPQPVQADFSDVLARGEGGLMGLVVHPDFHANREFTTCQTHQEDGRAVDIRLITWRLAEDGTRAERVGQPLLTGLPINPSGRHSGCRLAVAPDGALLVSTGDTARPTTAQDLRSPGGKVLRLDLDTGRPLPDNPFWDDPDPRQQLVLTYGHRNVQGLAIGPDGQVFAAEHGPDSEDELNLLRPGRNYGWDPSRGGRNPVFYDESVPMTDLRRFPDAVPPLWTSGTDTETVCAAAFLRGGQWGEPGVLAVTALKGSKLLLFRLAPGPSVLEVEVPPALDGTHGRLRGAQQGPDGALYVTTSNGTDDEVLRVTAR